MAGPTISSIVTPNGTSIHQYGIFEVGFTLSVSYNTTTGVYDPSVIDVRGAFWQLDAQGNALPSFFVPGFWFEDQTVSGTSTETYTPTGTAQFRIRFCPMTSGTWQYQITATDAGGVGAASGLTFNTTLPLVRGPIRVKNQTTFTYADGTAYIPIGKNIGIDDRLDRDGTAYYQAVLQAAGSNGENWTRFFMLAYDRTGLEWDANAAVRMATNKYKGLGHYAPSAAKRIDILLNTATANNLIVQMVLMPPGEWSSFTSPSWGVTGSFTDPSDGTISAQSHGPSPYNSAATVAGPINNLHPENYLTDVTTTGLLNRRMRYIAARWGAYWNVVWELQSDGLLTGSHSFNGLTATANGTTFRTNLSTFLINLANQLRSYSTNLVTWSNEWEHASLGGAADTNPAHSGTIDSVWLTTSLTGVPLVDFATYHDYPPSDATASSLNAHTARANGIDLAARVKKPVILSETGLPGAVESNYDPTSVAFSVAQAGHLNQGTNVHNQAWSSLMSGGLGGMYWYQGSYIEDDAAFNRVNGSQVFASTVPGTIDATGATDVTVPLAAYINGLSAGTTAYFPTGGTYKITGALKIGGRTNVTLEGQGCIIQAAGTGVNENFSLFYFQTFPGTNTGITIHGFDLRGNSPSPGHYIVGSEGQHGVLVDGGNNFTIYGNTIRGVYGDGIEINSAATAIRAHHNTVLSAGRVGMTVIWGNNVEFDHNIVTTSGYNSFDIEPNTPTETCFTISIHDNTAATWTNAFMGADGSNTGAVTHDISLVNNVCTGSSLLTIIGASAGTITTVTFTGNSSPISHSGPVLRFTNCNGLTVQHNTQPLSSGSLISETNCSGVIVDTPNP